MTGAARGTVFLVLLAVFIAPADGTSGYFIREDFNTLEAWEPLYFPGIPRHSTYSTGREGETGFLKCESAASASALVHRGLFSVYENQNLEWRWRIERVYDRGDETRKMGDDYTLRVYVMFKYDPETANLATRLSYTAAKLVYGEYPPHSSLNYIWANRDLGVPMLASPYTGRSMMLLVEKTAARAGEWITERVNLRDDYRRAFGADPPALAGIAVMNDSDNTGESSVSYLDYLYVY